MFAAINIKIIDIYVYNFSVHWARRNVSDSIQLANYTAILANNGYFYTPHVIKICNEQTEEPYVKCEEWEKIDSNLTEKRYYLFLK